MPNKQNDWNQESSEEQVIDVAGGVNSGDSDYVIGKNQLAYLKNGLLDKVGKRQRRLGVQSMGGPGAIGACIRGWRHDTGARWLIGLWDGEPWLTNGLGGWTLAAVSQASAYTSVAHDAMVMREYEYYGPPTSATISHTAIMFYPLSPTVAGGSVYERPFSVHEDRSIDYYTTIHFTSFCWWQQRGWIGDLHDAGYYEDTLAWSAIFDGSNFSGLATQNIRVDPGIGGRITKIMPARADIPRLYIFKEKAVYALDVVWANGATIPSTENTLDTTNSQVLNLSTSVGCVAPMTAVYASARQDADIFFLAADGLRSMARVQQDKAGGAGELVSAPIQDVIDRVNWSSIVVAWAEVFGDSLYLALPVDGATMPNICMIYDTKGSRWVGEYSFVPKRACVFDLTNQPLYMYGALATSVTDVPYFTTNPTFTAHLYQMHKANWYTDGAYTAVQYQETSRGFTFGNYGQKKRWDWLELMMEPAVTAATLTVEVKVDEESWVTAGYVGMEPSYNYPVLPAPLPWSFTSSKPAFKRVGLEEVAPGQKLQVRLTSDSPSSFAIRALRVTAWPYEGVWE